MWNCFEHTLNALLSDRNIDKRDIFIPESYKLCIHTALRRTPNPLSIYSRAALPFGKTALFVMKMKKPNYLAFMAAL